MFVRGRLIFALMTVALFLVASLPNASADVIIRHRIYRGRTVHRVRVPYTPLQPFSLDVIRPTGASRVNVAYYAPHAVPRAAQIEEDEESSPTPERWTS